MNGTLVANQFFNGQANSRTKITYNNGAEWHLLEAPEITLSNDETNCELVRKLYTMLIIVVT